MGARASGDMIMSIRKEPCMKASRIVFLVALVIATGAAASEPATVEPPKLCQVCRMDRTMFDFSRMLVEYKDGTTVGVCSVHCAAKDAMKHPEKRIASLKVADLTTKALIDAKTATWVVGGKKKGVMTAVPKWAFATKKDAEAFIKENGGTIETFDKVWKMAEKEE
jgi:copper chaperone NosL